MSGGLWAVTCLFNPAGFAARPRNFHAFAAALARQGVGLAAVELAFGDDPFSLPALPGVARLRGGSRLWQKERLLNHALTLLPGSCTAVAWLDADVLFADDRWAASACRALERYDVVQLFGEAAHLPPGALAPGPCGPTLPGTARSLLGGGPFESTAMGFAWAARRDWLSAVGLFEEGVLGSGDYALLGALFGRPVAFGVPGLDASIARWSAAVGSTRPRVGFVPGTLYHLYHGGMPARRYPDRHLVLLEHDFDPAADLRRRGVPLEWAGNKPALESDVLAYFRGRAEDSDFRAD